MTETAKARKKRISKHGTYMGPVTRLLCREALIMELLPPDPERVEAQFDDIDLDHDIEDLTEGVAHGWKIYLRKHFVMDEGGA